MAEIDVQEIIKQIRADIEKMPEEEKVLSFEDLELPGTEAVTEYNAAVFGVEVLECSHSGRLSAYRELHSRRGPLGSIIIFFKKVVRKCISFCLVPICEDQTSYNQRISRCLNQIRAYTLEMGLPEVQIDAINKLKEENRQLKDELKEMNERLQALEQNRKQG